MRTIIIGFITALIGIYLNKIGLSRGYFCILFGSVIMLIKVFALFVCEDKKQRKKQKSIIKPDPPPVQVPQPIHKPEPAKEQKIIYSTVFKVAGVTFRCQKDPEENRQDIISTLKNGDLLLLEEYDYKDEPAYMVVDYRFDLDIGNVPKDLTEKLNNEFYGYTTVAEVNSVNSFMPEDGVDEIYYCKVKLEVLK